MDRLAIVVPCYNEEEVFADTARQLTGLVVGLVEKGKISPDSYMLFVNDGSTDHTWHLMREEFERNRYVSAINLAGNAGQQNALWAGLSAVSEHCDMAVSIDADLQDDIHVMEEMIDRFHAGADVVYGVRNQRKTDTFFKRATAHLFYTVMDRLETKCVYNHADYRLMSARALQQLMQYQERNLFVRGLVPLIGYPSDTVYYARKPRTAGKSKYPLSKMISVAWEGITSFSMKPMTAVMAVGGGVLLCALMVFVYILLSFFSGRAVSGWSSMMVSVWFLGGLQLFGVGMIGAYIGKTYLEVKRRPRFHIECMLSHDMAQPDSLDTPQK